MAMVSLDGLLGCLEVTEAAPGRFTAPHLDLDYHRIFGGQLLAQAIAASAATTQGKSVKSLACLFPRQGSTEEPVDLLVERPHDGRAFATRRVTAVQGDRPFFLADVSLHVDETGLEHDAPGDRLAAPLRTDPAEATTAELTMIPWTTRVVQGVDLGDRAAGPPAYAFWTRVEDRRLPDDLAVHQALLAYATDLTVIGTALRPHDGYSQADAGSRLATAVTSHNVWFHRPFHIDEWCLVTQASPVTAGGRGFGVGHVLDQAGRVLATFAQESMIRLMEHAVAGPG